MRRRLALPFAFALVAALAVVAAPASAEEGKTIDNPEYVSWSKLKVGTWVRLRTDTEAGGQTSVLKMTNKLVEVSADKLVLETTMVTIVGDAEYPMPAQKRDVPAKITLPPQEQPAEATDQPKPKEGTEDLDVAGKKVKAKWMESESVIGGMKSVTRIWTSEEVPGGTAKMVSTTTGDVASKTTLTVEAWE